jgi:hypothetical protein
MNPEYVRIQPVKCKIKYIKPGGEDEMKVRKQENVKHM